MKNQKTFCPTFGVFMHDLDESIGHKRFQGMQDQSRQLGVNLLYFLQGTRTEPESNNIFNKLVSPKLDGIITGLSARTSLMRTEALESYFKQFNLPIVTLMQQWEDTSSVLFDQYQGMRQAILHLVRDHHYRRILFIRGPVDHCAAIDRYRAYVDVMQECNLYDPALVTPPVDWKPNLKESFEQLIAGMQPGRDFEAVAASNDDWAMEVIYCLQNRGVNVPGQVAVIGFNDTVQAKSFNPPLTTVANSFYEQGKQAIRTLHRMIEDPNHREQVLIPVNLIIRQSCGCLDPLITKTYQIMNTQKTAGVGQVPTGAELAEVINRVLEDEGLAKANRWTETLLESLFTELDNGSNSQTFLQILNSAMLSAQEGDGLINRWQSIITVIQQMIIPTLDQAKQEKAERLLHQARILIGSNALWESNNVFSQYKEKFLSANTFQTYLIRSFDIGEIVNLLARHLPQLGFYSCYFVLYDDCQPYLYPRTAPKWARLMLAYNPKGKVEMDMEGKLFPVTELLPSDLFAMESPFSYVVAPLFYMEYQFGYIFLGMGEQTQLSYKIVIPQLKACLRGVHLFKERKMVEESLVQQALELARSNSELQQFANIASHDLQEPLRKVLTFGERLRKSSSNVLPENGRLYLERIEHAAGRMYVLINDLLTFSRVNTKTPPFVTVDLNQIYHEVVTDIELEIAKYHGTITCEKLVVIEADALQMRQLFQNLISNALKFHREDCIPQLKIYQRPVNPGIVEIVFEDNGIGIEEIYFDRIFNVFERLHTWNEYEGTGVGLAICKKIVERHRGFIKIESTPGVGTKFIIRLPIQQNQRRLSRSV